MQGDVGNFPMFLTPSQDLQKRVSFFQSQLRNQNTQIYLGVPVLLFAIATIVVSDKVSNATVARAFQIALVSLFGFMLLVGFGLLYFAYRGLW